MIKRVFTIFIICFASLGALAQTEKYAAPVKWERYKVSDKDFSILLPKMPVLIRGFDDCLQKETNKYAVYADETVYGLTIISKSNRVASSFLCQRKGFVVKEQFNEKLNEIRVRLKTSDETKFVQNEREVIKLKSLSQVLTYWIIGDFKDNKVYELWIAGKDAENTEVKRFIESVDTNKNTSGIEIGEGESRILGDENIADTPEVLAQDKGTTENKNEEVENIKIFFRPFAVYTDKARQAETTGIVRLKVTFSANGGIKAVVIEKELKNGLTEQAIAAAMKIAFIPARRYGKPVTVTKTVEYSFSIY